MTLLFTDIEGSTQHWEQRREAMAEALRRHDELLRRSIEAHGGHIFKTVGDAFCAAFSRASDAAAAAADSQRTLAAEDWSAVDGLAVRMALHSGATDERDGDYFGPTVNRVARLLAVAHGGQVVASAVTASLLRDQMPPLIELRDLGDHRLKDLVEPEHVWQLVAPDLVETFPPLQSLGPMPNNLPRPVTPLVGRQDVLPEIEALVLERPLVTLVGTGGVGKTRLALQAGADLLDRSADGVWFVELALLTDATLVVNTIASLFGLCEKPNRSMLDVLLQYLRTRKLVIVLDNCEHLIDETARVADAILRAAPHVRIVATSREPLRIAGEHAYRVPSLSVPASGSFTGEEARRYGAIDLFAERAAASDATFTITDENAAIVAEICRRLDGIALAIELAAARVNALSLRQLADMLDERFHVLTGGSRTSLPRQKTMRALIDWSHDLLTEPERRLFRRLAVFAGGWSLKGAVAVCSDETLGASDVMDLLTSLVEKSLVVADAALEITRYRFLESTSAFALEKLEESGERKELSRRHLHWAADLSSRGSDARFESSPSRPFPEAEFVPELENARAALDWAIAHDEVVPAAHILIGYGGRYRMLVGQKEVRRRLEWAVARLDAPVSPALAARAWLFLAQLSDGSRGIEAARYAAELAERHDLPARACQSLAYLALRLASAGRTEEARTANQRALRRVLESDLIRSYHHAHVLSNKAVVDEASGLFDEARESYAEAISLAVGAGNESESAAGRLNMAELEFRLGNSSRALELALEVARLPRDRGFDHHIVTALVNAAGYQLLLGDLDQARLTARDALRLAHGRFGSQAMFVIQYLAAIAARSGESPRGARLAGYVDARCRDEGITRETTEQGAYELLMTTLKASLSGAEIETLASEGAGLSEDQALAEALLVG